MICQNCQKEIENSSTFCIFCGAQQPAQADENKKKKGCLIAAIICAAALVLVLAILVIVVLGIIGVGLYTMPVKVAPAERYEEVWESDQTIAEQWPEALPPVEMQP